MINAISLLVALISGGVLAWCADDWYKDRPNSGWIRCASPGPRGAWCERHREHAGKHGAGRTRWGRFNVRW